MRLRLPDNVDAASIAGPLGPCVLQGAEASCQLGDLQPDGSARVRVAAVARGSGWAIGEARLVGPGGIVSAQREIGLTVDRRTELLLTATAVDRVVPRGAAARLKLEVANRGLDSARNIVVDVPLESAATIISARASQGLFDTESGRWSVGELDPDRPVELELSLNLHRDDIVAGLAELVEDGQASDGGAAKAVTAAWSFLVTPTMTGSASSIDPALALRQLMTAGVLLAAAVLTAVPLRRRSKLAGS
jgi:hypothetical protein